MECKDIHSKTITKNCCSLAAESFMTLILFNPFSLLHVAEQVVFSSCFHYCDVYLRELLKWKENENYECFHQLVCGR